MIQWLRLPMKSSSAAGVGLIPGGGAQIPPASLLPKKQKIKQKQYCKKFNKDLKNGPHEKNLKSNMH